MSVQATSGVSASPSFAKPAPVAVASSAAAAQAAPQATSISASKGAEAVTPIEKPQLHQAQKVDLGFRADEMRKNLQEAVSRLNDQMKSKGRDLNFSMDERINRTVITVKNMQTGEVVRQIPTEQVVQMAHSIEDMKGLLFNETM